MSDVSMQIGEWHRHLEKCRYAGEVIIAEEELPVLAKAIRGDLLSARGSSRDTLTILLVLAINCMYYESDERGFWIHFCGLLKASNDAQTQSWLGAMLESQILNFGLLNEPSRARPWRYVSVLREQTGITRKVMPKFAQFLIYLSEHHGWDGIRAMDRRDFNRSVRKHLPSSYLSKFLLSNEGYDFTVAVARNISQYHRNALTISGLEKLRGYRTGFFRELFSALGHAAEKPSRSVARPPLPRLVFLPEISQVALSFDREAVNSRAYLMGRDEVTSTPIPCDSAACFCASISGKRRDTSGKWSNWNIIGWVPHSSKIGLFHKDRGYIEHQQGVSPGDYYMLAPYDKPPPEELIIHDYGVVDLPFEGVEYEAWRIQINETTDLSFMGINQYVGTQAYELIKWAHEMNSLPGSIDLELVFTRELPSITLKRTELFASNEAALFLDYNGNIQKIDVADAQSSVQLNVSPPGRGRIWAEPFSRRREFAGLDTLGELPFCLLPDCDIKWPTALYRDEDEPEIHLVSAEQEMILDLENASPITENHRFWKVIPKAALVQGYLRYADMDIRVARKIFRAALRKQVDKQTRYIVKRDFDGDDQMLAAGLPRQAAFLYLLNGSESISLGQIGTFNDVGECRFPAQGFRDALISRYKQPVGLFAIGNQDELIETSTYFVNCDHLCQWIADSDEENPKWLSLLPKQFAETIRLLHQVSTTPLRDLPQLDTADQIPSPIRSFQKLIRISAVVFDGAILAEYITESEEEIIRTLHDTDPVATKFLQWYSQAKEFYHAEQTAGEENAESLLDEYPKLLWNPPFTRWREEVSQIVAHLKATRDVVPLIEEWARDIEKGFRAKYTSRIGNQRGGRDLTVGWIRYRKGNFQGAVNTADPLITKSASPIVELTDILLKVSWLRLGCFASQRQLAYESGSKKLLAACKDLAAIINFGSHPGESVPVISELPLLLKALPLSTEDRRLLGLFSTREVTERAGFETDWLYCYYSLRLAAQANDGEEAKHFAGELKDLLASVPESPDKEVILEIVEKHL